MNDQRFVLVLFLCLIAGSNSQSSWEKCADGRNLTNMAVYEGTSSSFFNLLDRKNVKWEIYPSYDHLQSPPYTIADGNVLQPPFLYSYTVTPTQLRIPKASVYPQSTDPYSTSGQYQVTYTTAECRSMAHLIVVTKGPLCLCTTTYPDKAVLSCILEYGGRDPLRAMMAWHDESGKRISPSGVRYSERGIYNVVTSTSYVSISRSDATSFTCEVTFDPPSSPSPFMVTNAPDFSASCTVANCLNPSATTTQYPMKRLVTAEKSKGSYGCSSHSFSAGFIMMTCLVSLVISF